MLPSVWKRNQMSSPFRWFSELENEMDRFFNSLEPPMSLERRAANMVRPNYNLDETETHYMINVDLPGVRKSDVNVELDHNVLHIGAKRTLKEKKNGSTSEFTRTYSSAFTIPDGIEPEKCETNFHDGVLQFAIEKPKLSQPKKIDIKDKPSGIFKKLLASEKTEDKRPKLEKQAIA